MSTETLEKVAQLVKADKNLDKYLDKDERRGTYGSAIVNSGKFGGKVGAGVGISVGAIKGAKHGGILGAVKGALGGGAAGAIGGAGTTAALGSTYGLVRGAKRALMGQHSVSQHELERRHKHSMNKD